MDFLDSHPGEQKQNNFLKAAAVALSVECETLRFLGVTTAVGQRAKLNQSPCPSSIDTVFAFSQLMSFSSSENILRNPYLQKKKRPPEHQDSSLGMKLSSLETTQTEPLQAQLQQQEASSQKLAADSSNSHSLPSNDVSSSASALIISAADKAGMEGIDRSKIDEIILRESGNSLYMQQQRKRDEKVNHRIQQLKSRLSLASPQDYQVTPELEELLETYIRHSPTRSTCVVIDMDMFFMACELLTRPHLKNVPACVGHGMITTSNYVARRYGVRSAMAGFIGDKLVEELSGGTQKLHHVRSNFELYREKSHIVKDVLREYDPFQMKSYSLDEAYLDIGPYLSLFLQHEDWTHEQIRDALQQTNDKDPSATAMQYLQSLSSLTCMEAADRVVAQLRQRVTKATGGLTCSAGVAPNVSLAKIASDKNKPNGQLLVDPSRVLEFVHSLPIRKIPGIGRVTEKVLQQVCHVHTVHDLYQQRGLVQWLFPPSTSEFLLKACVGCNGSSNITTSDFGMDDDDHGADTSSTATDHQKGISRERTFSSESDWSQLCIRLEDIARKLFQDMTQKSVLAHTVTVKVKLASFDVLSRGQSMKRGVYVQSPDELVDCVSLLFSQIRAQFKKDHAASRFVVRLLGIRCSNLISEELFESSERGTLEKYLTNSTDGPAKPGGEEIDSSNNDVFKRSAVVNLYAPGQKRSRSPPRLALGTKPKEIVSSKAWKENAPQTLDPLHRILHTPADEDLEAKTEGNDEEYVNCPLCSKQYLVNDNAGLNAHIDTCLNGSTVRQAIQEEESQLTQPSSKKPKQLADFWNLS